MELMIAPELMSEFVEFTNSDDFTIFLFCENAII
jgi:hypothetical protein